MEVNDFLTGINKGILPLPAHLWGTDFFPPLSWHFVISTDDGSVFFCSRQQSNGKSLFTPNNDLLYRYFCKRLGVEVGNPIKMADLFNYGKTGVDFYKFDDENFFMDFSPPQNTKS